MSTEPERVERQEGRLDRVRVLLGLIALALLGVLVWSVFSSRGDAEQARQETRTLAQQVSAACDAGGAAERELEAIGACDQAATAAVGVQVEPAPVVQVATDAQVRTAVAAYLQEHPPAAGRTPTSAEVEAAVARVCEAIGCRGEAGEKGDDGNAGVDGADATDQQVAAQVAAYCTENHGCLPTAEEIQAAVAAYCSVQPSPCAGPQGAQGEPGPVLPEYYVTSENTLGVSVTRHCIRDGETLPPRYNCSQE